MRGMRWVVACAALVLCVGTAFGQDEAAPAPAPPVDPVAAAEKAVAALKAKNRNEASVLLGQALGAIQRQIAMEVERCVPQLKGFTREQPRVQAFSFTTFMRDGDQEGVTESSYATADVRFVKEGDAGEGGEKSLALQLSSSRDVIASQAAMIETLKSPEARAAMAAAMPGLVMIEEAGFTGFAQGGPETSPQLVAVGHGCFVGITTDGCSKEDVMALWKAIDKKSLTTLIGSK